MFDDNRRYEVSSSPSARRLVDGIKCYTFDLFRFRHRFARGRTTFTVAERIRSRRDYLSLIVERTYTCVRV